MTIVHHVRNQDDLRQYHELTYTLNGHDTDGSFLIPCSEPNFIYLQIQISRLTCTLEEASFLIYVKPANVVGPILDSSVSYMHTLQYLQPLLLQQLIERFDIPG